MSTKIRDIMSHNVHYVNPDDSLQEAAKQMRSNDVGFLPVVSGQELVGAVTDRDIAVKAVAEGRDPKKTHVKDVATKDVAFCYADQDPDDAAKVMKDKEVRRVMVIDRESKQLVGVVSVGDLATKDSSKTSGSVMEKTGPK
jgi:CBS domain-containing protein